MCKRRPGSHQGSYVSDLSKSRPRSQGTLPKEFHPPRPELCVLPGPYFADLSPPPTPSVERERYAGSP